MRIKLTSVHVDDQPKALAFYTSMLGFVEVKNIPMGKHAWLTVRAPDDADGIELLLEPMGLEATRAYQAAVRSAGIPWTALEVDDVAAEHARLVAAGVRFTTPPTPAGPTTIAVFDDTCGNLIQIYQA